MIVVAVSLRILTGCNPTSQEATGINAADREIPGVLPQPPASLDQFYPPVADGPLYMFRMMDLNNLFVGVINDVMTNDLENAMAGLENFRKEYADISNLIPEWKDYYPAEPLEIFSQAARAGDPGQLMPAVEELGKVCHRCHVSTMTPVKYKYHWGDFASIAMEDPFRGGSMDYKALMQYLNAGLAGIGNELSQDQAQGAMGQYQVFNVAFQLMKGTCRQCHQLEREYYVDQGVQTMIDRLGVVLSSTEINRDEVGDYIAAIGTESCFNCHLVHLPASLTKDGWSMTVGGGNSQ